MPHWLPASSRRCRSASPSPVPRRPAVPESNGTPGDAFPHRSTAACARSSCDPAHSRAVESPRTPGSTTSLLFARRSLVRYRSLRSTPPAADGSRFQERDQGVPCGGRIELLALPFHKSVEIVSREKLVQTLIKGMARGPRQFATRHPNLFLLLPPRAHRHMTILRSNILLENCFFTFTPDC